MKKDSYCSICNCGLAGSEKILVCWECQKELMPEYVQDEEEPTINQSIADYNGFYHYMY